MPESDHTELDHTELDHAELGHAERDHAERDHAERDHAERDHAERVEAWLQATTPGASTEELLGLLEHALNAIWRRTKVTLGEVTLTAIVDRVLYNATEQYPFFAAISLEPSVGFRCEGLRERTDAQPSATLVASIRFVLVELLSVLGNLTADILTPELHEALARVHRPDPGGATAVTGDPAVTEPESAES